MDTGDIPCIVQLEAMGIVFVLPVEGPIASVVGAVSGIDVECPEYVVWSMRSRLIFPYFVDADFAYSIAQDSIEGYVDLRHDLEATFLGAGGTAIFPILGEFQVPIEEAMNLIEFGLELGTQIFRALEALTEQVRNN